MYEGADIDEIAKTLHDTFANVLGGSTYGESIPWWVYDTVIGHGAVEEECGWPDGTRSRVDLLLAHPKWWEAIHAAYGVGGETASRLLLDTLAPELRGGVDAGGQDGYDS